MFTFLLATAVWQSLGLRPETGNSRGVQIARLDEVVATSAGAAESLKPLQTAAGIVNAIMLQTGNATEHDCNEMGRANAPCGLAIFEGMPKEHLVDAAPHIKDIIREKCIEEGYKQEMCDGISETLFDGVDLNEPNHPDAICKELQDLVSSHWCHVESRANNGALLQRTFQNGTLQSTDATLANKNGGQKSGSTTVYFYLKNHNRCLTAKGSSNGAILRMKDCSFNDPMQQWSWDSNNIKSNGAAGYCLDAYQMQNGGNVHMWSCDKNNQNQQWSHTINKNKPSIGGPLVREQSWWYWFLNWGADEYCLDFPGGDARPHAWVCDETNSNQWWREVHYSPYSGWVNQAESSR